MARLPEQRRDSCSSLPGRASFPRMQISPAAQHCHRGNHQLMGKHTTTRMQLCCLSSQAALFFHGVKAEENQKASSILICWRPKWRGLSYLPKKLGLRNKVFHVVLKVPVISNWNLEPLCSCPTLVHIA